MIISPYDTTVGKTYDVNAIVETGLRCRGQAYYNRNTIKFPDDSVQIHQVTEDWKGVPFFNQVVVVEDPLDPSRYLALVDVRQMTSTDKESNARFKSSNEKLFTETRAVLTAQWALGKQGSFAACSDVPCTVFSQWILKALSRSYVQDPATQVRLMAITGFFFMSQFQTDKMNEREGIFVATKLAKVLKLPESIVNNLVLDIGERITDVAHFCQCVAKHSENITLDNMNPAKLYSALGNWYGAAGAEHVAVAVEYPPTFYAMVMMAIQDNSYRKTSIGEILKNSAKAPGLHQLLGAMKPLLLAK